MLRLQVLRFFTLLVVPTSGCVVAGENCRGDVCCQGVCYEKDEYWAGCRSDVCETNAINPADPAEQQTPWSCKEVGMAKMTNLNLGDLNETSGINFPNGFWCRGINAAGYDLDAMGLSGDRRDKGYREVDKVAVKHFHDRGLNCFRLPITLERMQTKELFGTDSLQLVDGYAELVSYITEELGDYVIIDPHNNDEGLRFHGVDITKDEFVNLWKACTKTWGKNGKAIFGLYNEPKNGKVGDNEEYFEPNAADSDGQMITNWVDWLQSSIDAIRAEGGENMILAPGLHYSQCRDFDGAGWWGETLLPGEANAGNTRLAALHDPLNLLAYDVHQYFDPSFMGTTQGCDGHVEGQFGGYNADDGLDNAIAWAKRFNKKFMMTEIGSFPSENTTLMFNQSECEAKMNTYVQKMLDSGVFLGLQVWQFGCPSCLGDQWTLRPYNLHWYFPGGLNDPPTTTSTSNPFRQDITPSTSEVTTAEDNPNVDATAGIYLSPVLLALLLSASF